MANVIITLKIMPSSPEEDLERIKINALQVIKDFTGETETRTSIHPVAFGLQFLQIIFVADEKKGSTEALENKIAEIEGVNSVEVTDVRRAIG